MGDVVVWNGTPFSVYAQADVVLIDGALAYDRANPPAKPEIRFHARAADRECAMSSRAFALFAVAVAILGTPALHAQTPRGGDVLIRGARVHTVTSRGVLEKTDVLVRGGRISAVGAGSQRRPASLWLRRTGVR